MNETVTHEELQQHVIELAHRLGWVVAHFRPAKTDKGWRTAVAADGAGFPDLVMVRERMVVAEIKTEKDQPSFEQWEWMYLFQHAGCEAFLWRPSDWDEIVEVLQ